MFSGDREYPEDLEKGRRGGHTDDEAFIAKYSITLSAAKHNPGQPVAPEDLRGRVTFWELWAAFEGVRGVREGWSSDGAVMESFWEVLLTENHEEDEEEVWLDDEGNAVGVAAVLDDNGSPFLVFDWHHPPMPRCSWSGYYVGKRLVEGKDWRLTDEERGRLGIGATFRSVEQLFKEGTPGMYPDDPAEEETAAGKKRKMSTDESSTDDTGTKKKKVNTDGIGAKKGKVNTDEIGAKKGKANTDGAGAEKGKANTDGTGAKRHRKRRRRRGKALMVPGPVTAAER